MPRGAVRVPARAIARRLVPEAWRPAVKAAARQVTWRLYAGDRYECPCCDTRFRAFLGFGRGAHGGSRPNVRCPRCGSLERERLIWLFLRDHGDLLTSPMRLLHVAPEPQLRRRLRGLSGVSYLCGDLARGMADTVIDIRSMPFPDETFDGIICNHVLEHVPEDRQAMAELRRVLRRDGWAILQVPLDPRRERTDEDPTILDPAVRTRRFGQADHVRIYGRDYAGRLAEAGFEVSEEPGPPGITAADRDRHRLAEEEVIFLCRPRAAAAVSERRASR